MSCCVRGCRNRYAKGGFKFYRIPYGKQLFQSHRRRLWLQAINRPELTEHKNARICGAHFISGEVSLDWRSPDFVPSVFPCTKQSQNPQEKTERNKDDIVKIPPDQPGPSEDPKQDSRTDHCYALSAADGGEDSGLHLADSPDEAEEEESTGRESDGDLIETGAAEEEAENLSEQEVEHEASERHQAECQVCVHRRMEINRLLHENKELKAKLSKRKMDEEFLKGNTDRVRYYTGLPWFPILLSIVNVVKPFLPPSSELSPFQMVLMTLIRLRLDLPVQHLSHLFNVSAETLSSTFASTIEVLYAHLNPLVHWPERHRFQVTMPGEFLEAFGQGIAVVVDCFEVHTEGISHTQNFNHDNDKHTKKYLVGFTPQRSVTFISRGWEWHDSDMHITESCGLLSKLLPGDVVLAGRGFGLADGEGLMCAEVKSSDWEEGGCQLDVKDAADTQTIAHLQSHVKTVIDSLQSKYTMLQKRVPFSLLLPCEGEEMTLLDKTVNVCCILLNMSPSVVVKTEDDTFPY